VHILRSAVGSHLGGSFFAGVKLARLSVSAARLVYFFFWYERWPIRRDNLANFFVVISAFGQNSGGDQLEQR
jgi:hypothetical protein